MLKTSRRDALKAGICTAVIGAATVAGVNLTRTREAKAAAAEHPYGYPVNGLDVEATRQLGYDGYKGLELDDGIVHKRCSFATFNALISQLAEDVGYPYNEIPTQMMEWGYGGVASYATFCGALNGTCAAIGAICDNNNANAIISDLINWYSETALPTNIIAPTDDIPQSIASGNLCHMSVSRWCKVSGFASGSSERSERCARLSGDVVARAVEMLNGSVTLTGAVPRDKTVCGQCHYKGTNYEGGQFTRGTMDCTTCHTDIKKNKGTGYKRYGKMGR